MARSLHLPGYRGIHFAEASETHLGESQRVDLGESDAKGQRAPKWQKLFPAGEKLFRDDFPTGIEFSPATLETMAKNYAAEGKPERAVNYFHRGASNVPGKVEEKVASGWIK